MADIAHGSWIMLLLGSLSKVAFERRMSTRSESFALSKRLDTTNFVLLNVFRIKPLPKNANCQLLVDVRR